MIRSKAKIKQDKKILADYRQLSKRYPDIPEYEVRTMTASRNGVSPVTVWRAIKRTQNKYV